MVHELRSGFMFRAPPVRDLVQGSSRNKYKNPDKKRKRSTKAMEIKAEQNPCSDSVQRLRRVIHDLTGQPVNTENQSSQKPEKEICGLAPIVRCPPPNDKRSESCIQKDGADQDMHYQPVLPDKIHNPVPQKVEEEEGSLKASCRVDVKLKRPRRVTHDQPVLPAKTEIASFPELDKEGGSLKVSCHMDVKPARMIDNAISQVDARGQLIMAVQQELQREIKGIPRSQHSSDKDVLTRQQTFDSEEANLSPNNVLVCTEQHVSDSGEATESPGTEISRNISLVETIYLKRMKKLLSYQSMNCTQFKKDRDRVKEELIANLRKEHLLKSALVRTMHTQIQVRIAETKLVDKEFIRKVQILENYLDTEQKKLKTMLKAAKKEEKDLKYHWLQEAKSGRTVDVFSILPQFLYSYLNLDGLKNPSERLLLNSSNNANSVLPHALQIELPTAMDSVTEPVLTNESEDCTTLVVQLQSPLPTNALSELGNGTRVSENSRLCQRIKEENQVPILNINKELARIGSLDGAQPVKFREELKVCINTDFVDTASAQKKRAVGTSFNRVIGSLGSHQDKVQLKVRGEPTPCSNVKLERKVDQTGLPVGTEDSSNVKVKLEKSLDPSDQFGVQRTSHWWDPVTAPGLRVGSPANVICIPEDLDVICISDDDN